MMEFELKGNQYRTAKLSVFDQLKVSRKLLPVVAGLLKELKPGEKLITEEKPDSENDEAPKLVLPPFGEMLPKIAQSMADLSDEDLNAILFPCLAVAMRQHGTNWTPVFDRVNKIINFDDLDMMDILQIVGKVVGDSLGNFFPALPANKTPVPPSA
jgi:hypothetical protein